MSNLSKAAALVGAAEANEIGYPDEPRTSLQLHIEAIKNVSDYTGIPIADIDGVFSTAWSSDLGEHLVKAHPVPGSCCGNDGSEVCGCQSLLG